MAITSNEQAASNDEFGANDWLIEELYEQYSTDPSSVDPTWAQFFATRDSHEGGPSSPASAPAAAEKKTLATPSPQAADKPAEKPVPAAETPARAPQPKADKPAEAPKPKTQAAPTATSVSATTQDRATPSTTSETPKAPAQAQSRTPAQSPANGEQKKDPASGPKTTPLRELPLRTAKNMDTSLEMPVATSVRTIPMKLVITHRTMINQHLRRTTGGKVSFTHLIGFAMVQALKAVPAMNTSYTVVDGKPSLVEPDAINLGLAIDLSKPDGTRQLLVPAIKNAGELTFAQFWNAYEALVRKARKNELTVDDFAGTTASLTNPGGIGTNHSIPRLMTGQGMILGVGSIDYAPGFLGANPERLNEIGVSKVMSLTSTYDHRVIQGAQSGEFLRTMEELLLGQHDFYEDVFTSLRIPFAPLRWATDQYDATPGAVDKQARVLELINSYRTLGHLRADIDPLTYRMRTHPDLELDSHGLTIWDLDRSFPVGTLGGLEHQTMTLHAALDLLADAYCRTTGVEYMHISDPVQRRWLQERLERGQSEIDHEKHMRILDKLNEAEIFETFLQTKFIGQKRFSLEGGESTIVALDEICDLAADEGLDEVCIGMPHRGRLNVLANIVGKSYAHIFREFEGRMDPHSTQGTGDVKYHLGAEGEFTAASGATIRASVAANPSHLEAVNPVVEGITRAKQDRSTNEEPFSIVPILLHGDASFAGQGIVYETLQMSQLRGYATGGTIHIIVNNQVGFTTAPSDSRSSTYCSDVAKAIQAPIFHVNGDDADACVRAARLAFEYRQRFHKDVVIDLVCYRRRGHNEGDDPSFTQPLMYDLIEAKRTTRRIYTDALIGRGDISVEDSEVVAERFRQRLETVFREVRAIDTSKPAPDDDRYRKVPFYPRKLGKDTGTSIDRSTMERIAASYTEVPEGFAVHPKVAPQMHRRAEAILNGPIDWATAEILAFGSLLLEGRPVRLTGQDSRRGTFSQRFAAIIDRHANDAFIPLQNLSEDQGAFDVYDSFLSEYAVMGFEYGYSVAAPEALVLWEAQFGDFANGGQTISDEFIAAGNAKWTQKSGVVLLLPHGYEGQGPDHSSARIERWLQLCSEGALAVCQPSTPASHFHLLRTHAYVNWHRPLIIATPKSMLRNKLAVSTPDEFTNGSWQPAMGDPSITDPSAVERVVLCSGKIRWDLVAQRAKLGLDGKVAILSLERLYPLPTQHLAKELEPYRHVTDVIYAQDEPANQGAWWFMKDHLPAALKQQMGDYDLVMRPVTREEASAPSVGSHKVHEEQEAALLKAALVDA